MRRLRVAATLGCLATLFAVTSASAAPDTWVSGTGVDAGVCSPNAPCRSFQYALQHTKDNGTIAVASSGIFDGVSIRKPVTISAEHVVAILRTAASCGAVICINVQNGLVTLRGLTIDPMKRGANGIEIAGGNGLRLKDDVIRQSRVGLLVTSPGGAFGVSLEVGDSLITSNDLGIRVVAARVTHVTGLALLHTRVFENTDGILFDDPGAGGKIFASLSNSLVAGHAGYGIRAVGPSADTNGRPFVAVTLDRTAVLNNKQGIVVDGTGSRVRIGNSTINGNSVALRTIRGGVIPSYGTNQIDGNGGGETPTLTIPNQ